MSNPIQIAPPNIGATGIAPNAAEVFLKYLLQGSDMEQRSQQLDLEKERLRQEKQRHTDAQAEHDKEKANLAQLGEVARSLLLSMQPPTILPQGSIPFGAGAMTQLNVGAQSPFADLVRGLPAESVPQMLPLLQQMSTLQGTDLKNAGQGLSNTGQALTNQQTATTIADDQAIDRIVSGLETGPLNRASVARTITRVAAISPAKASQLASSLGGLVPGFTPHVNENGTVSWISNEPGGVAGAPVQPKPGDADQRKASGYGRRVLEANATMTELENRYKGIGQRVDDWLRSARAAGQLPLVGKSAEIVLTPQFLRTLVQQGIPAQAAREYVNSRFDLGNAILRNVSGATINLEELDREIAPYVPMYRMTEDAVPSIQQRRLALGLQFVDQAGVEFKPERLSPLARKYLLRAMTGSQGSEEPTDSTLKVLPGVTTRPVQP